MKIFLLCDYKGFFSSKWGSVPYRSGMDKKDLEVEFSKYGIKSIFLNFTDIDFNKEKNSEDYYLYSSSEDTNLLYKSYIEDIILGLELKGANLIPSFKYLRAHHNKCFMEILRLSTLKDISYNIQSKFYGTYEDLLNDLGNFHYPVVFKLAFGAASKTVRKADNESELINIVKKLSYSPNIKHDVWDYVRSLKHGGYKRESRYRQKFIIQNFIPNLPKDWKVLIFGNKYYILERKVRKNDFRSSGSGLISYPENIPEGLLEFSKVVFEKFDLPFIGIDVAYDEDQFFLIEFQTLYFGTHTLETAPYYYEIIDGQFIKKVEDSKLEKVFAKSVYNFLIKR